jgi:hypothetical protein
MKDNSFIKKFRNKTDSDLRFILDNKEKYTQKAIEASTYILKERNGELIELETNKEKLINELKEDKNTWIDYEKKEYRKWEKNYYATKLLWFGISCIVCAFYFFAPTLFTTKNSLIEINGEIQNVNTFYTQVSSKGHKSVKSELLLKLENDKRTYKIFKNIEQSWSNEKYELIKKRLKKSGKAKVWIKENQQSKIEPEVFQIATGENDILYDMNDVKSELRFIFPFLLIMGVFGIGVYVNHKFPNPIKDLIRKKPTHNKV